MDHNWVYYLTGIKDTWSDRTGSMSGKMAKYFELLVGHFLGNYPCGFTAGFVSLFSFWVKNLELFKILIIFSDSLKEMPLNIALILLSRMQFTHQSN